MLPTDVFVLDFDGVLCDSAAETAVSAWRTGRRFFPDWAGNDPPPAVVEDFVAVRPVLETGYQAILLLHRILAGVSRADIRREGAAAAETLLPRLGLDKPTLIRAFGETRDAWIAADPAGWLARHRFYPGTLERLRERLAAGCPVRIATTKQERFVLALLAGENLDFPAEHVFGLDSGKNKEQILRETQAEFPAAAIHFVEDRLDTLHRVEACPELAAVRLYYADWGYGLPPERAAAQANPRIQIWTLEKFLRG